LVLGFVEGRLGPDSVLQVESHTAECAGCLDLLATAVASTQGRDAKEATISNSSTFGIRWSRRPLPALAAGSVVGRYLLISLVGRGAMGEVYSAYDPELDRRVAIKLLNVEPTSGVTVAKARARLLREAKAIARLSHPNVVVVFDAGTFCDRLFIAMELVDGKNLSRWLDERPRSWREVRDVFLAAGRGLAAAHAAGLVHRDFKPQNVMVGLDGKARVTDFGLVRGLSAEAEFGGVGNTSESQSSFHEVDAALTQTGTLIGTPLYMSPEQFRLEPVDARSDQFSFAVALYEGLYGERPFPGESIATLKEAVIAGRLREPPAERRVPVWLRRVVLRGLRTDRDDRYPSIDQMMEALGQEPARRRTRLMARLAVIVAVVATILGAQRLSQRPQQMCLGAADRLSDVWEPDDAPNPRPRRAGIERAFLATGSSQAAETWERVSAGIDRYASRWRAAYTSACEATHVKGDQSVEVLDLRMTCLQERLGQLKALTDLLAVADAEVVAGSVNAVLALDRIERCSDVALLRAVVPPPKDDRTRALVEGLRARLATVKAMRDSGRHHAGVMAALSLVADARAIGYKPILAEAQMVLGFLQWSDGDLSGHEKSLTEAIWAAEASHHDEVKANAAGTLAGTAFRPEDAERWGRLAEATAERMGPGHERVMAWVLTGRSGVRNRLGDFAAGARFAREAISIKRRILEPRDPDMAFSLNNLAISLTGLGDSAGALAAIDEALAIVKDAYGDRSSYLGTYLSNRGEALNAQGNYEEARRMFQEAIGQTREQLPVDHPNIAYPLTGLGVAQVALGDARGAVGTLERALRIREATEPDALLVAETRFALARALWDAHQDRARALSLASLARAAFATNPRIVAQVTAVDAWLKPRCPPGTCSP
jgi:tetratricopeptide (TPR) repeat protein